MFPIAYHCYSFFMKNGDNKISINITEELNDLREIMNLAKEKNQQLRTQQETERQKTQEKKEQQKTNFNIPQAAPTPLHKKLIVRQKGTEYIEDYLKIGNSEKQSKDIIAIHDEETKQYIRPGQRKQQTFKPQTQVTLPWYKKIWNKVFCCCKFSAQQTHEEERSNEMSF